MDWKLEVVPLPVSDIDQAMEFYRDKAGFRHGRRAGRGMELVPILRGPRR